MRIICDCVLYDDLKGKNIETKEISLEPTLRQGLQNFALYPKTTTIDELLTRHVKISDRKYPKRPVELKFSQTEYVETLEE